MKVLILHAQLGVLRGGGETFTRNLFTAFAERGHDISAAFVADHRGRWPFPLPPCIEPIPIPGWWSSNLGQATLSSVGRCLPAESRYKKQWDRVQNAIDWRVFRWHNRRFQRRVEREFVNRWNEFDVIYVQSNVRLAGKIAGHRPTVLMLPGPVGNELLPILRSLHAVCAHDDGLVHLRAQLGDNALELPLGLDTQLFSPDGPSARRTLGWSDQHCVIGYVGRLTRLKGVDLLAAAFRQVLRTAANARLLLVGSGEEERNVRSIFEKEISGGIVHIEPAMEQEQLPRWYRAMDLIVMPSRYETMSNSVLEAMACELPFLASDIGGNRILGQTDAGWLFESESVPSLGANLQSIIKDHAGIKSRGKIGRCYLQQRYSWARSAERLEKIIHSRLGVRI